MGNIVARSMIASDLHLGHKNIAKYRVKFKTSEEHDEIVFDNLASNVNKRDSLIFLGDVCFTQYWLDKIDSINCVKKTLILGNHDTEKLHITQLVKVYDQIHGLWSKRNAWFSHCPIHPDEMRDRSYNIHGHSHQNVIDDPRYINACLEHTNYRPISFQDLMSGR